MKKQLVGLALIFGVGLAMAQEPDTTRTAPPTDPAVEQSQQQPQEEPAVEPVTTPEPKEPTSNQPVDQPTVGQAAQPESSGSGEEGSNQPKIIYYQSTPESDYQTRYRSDNSSYSYRSRGSRDDIKTLAGSMHHSGGFGALSFRSTEFRDETMVLAGVRAGWIINRTVGIGVEGHGIIPTAKYDGIDLNDEVFALGGYGGMFLEMIFFSNTVVHVTFPVSAGAGWFGFNEDWEDPSPRDPGSANSSLIDDDVFWYVEPGANLEVNIARNFRMDFGISKRFTQDLEMLNTNASEFENLNYYITLKVGGF